jgi:AraC-like DNA-binding protein
MCYEEWNASLRDCCGHYYSTPQGKLGDGHSFDVLDFNGMDVASVRCQIDRISRTRQGIRRDDAEHYFLLCQVEGTMDLIHNGRHETLHPGDFTLMDSTQIADMVVNGGVSNFRSVHIPRSLLLAGRDAPPLAGHKITNSHTMYRGLSTLVNCNEDWGHYSPGNEYFFDYIAMVFRRDEGRFSAMSFRDRESRLRFVREVIDCNLHDETFSIDALCFKVSRSRRQLQRELAHSGTTFSELLQKRRLRYLIAEKRRSDRIGRKTTLAELAARSGFSDQSHFNRIFRQYYGLTPTVYFSEFRDLS